MYQLLIWVAVLRDQARGMSPPGHAQCLQGLTNALVHRVRRDIELDRDFLRGQMLRDKAQAVELPLGQLRHTIRNFRLDVRGVGPDRGIRHSSFPFSHPLYPGGWLRVSGYDMDDLAGTLWETNDVKSGELVVVRGSYFERYWNDPFKFGATWLNGKDLDWAGSNKKSRVEKFNDGGPVYNLNLLAKAHKAGRPKPGEILRRIEDAIRRLPDNRGINHVTEFKDEWRETRKIDMRHLDKAVANGRVGLVKKVRDEIRRLIDALPDE